MVIIKVIGMINDFIFFVPGLYMVRASSAVQHGTAMMLRITEVPVLWFAWSLLSQGMPPNGCCRL